MTFKTTITLSLLFFGFALQAQTLEAQMQQERLNNKVLKFDRVYEMYSNGEIYKRKELATWLSPLFSKSDYL